jgi:hypothetical protein
MENSEDLNKKCWILRDKELYPNRVETNVKGPQVEGRTFWKTREAMSTKQVMRWAEMGPGQPILGPIRAPLWPRRFSDYL